MKSCAANELRGKFDPFPRARRTIKTHKTFMKRSALQSLARAARRQKTTAHILSSSLAFIAASLLVTGCASIVDGGPKTVTIRSDPPGAKVTIYDRRGREVLENTTPATVDLNSGGFFRPRSYRVAFDMPGYRTCETGIDSRINPWYWGNFLLVPFSPIGFLVDPATGGMWTIQPTRISCTLRR